MLSVAAGLVAMSLKVVTRMADRVPHQFDLNIAEDEDINLVDGPHQFDLNIAEGEDINLVDDHQPKRRRHAHHQIQEMEAIYKDCPNPDYRQRRALGLEVGLEPQQVKYWFQNKRTQLKTQHGHLENAELQAENKRLKDENMSLMEHLKNAACTSCGSAVVVPATFVEEHQLRAENVRLREEIDCLSAIAAQYIGKPVTDPDSIPHSTGL